MDRGDDCAGLLVVRGLRSTTVTTFEVYADGVELMEAWSGADRAIVVDAVVSGSKPGTVFHWDGRNLPAGIDHPVSSHGFGMAEAIALAKHLKLLPARLDVIGIEAGHFDYGRGVSAEVATAARIVARNLAAELTCTKRD
jgi:hydrogenase maturation protease